MRLITWNILHGGGSRRMPLITLRLLELKPDIVVLTEFRATCGGQIAGVLADHGLIHQCRTPQPAGRNGVLIASRWPIIEVHERPQGPGVGRWLDATIEHKSTTELRVTGVHLPDATRSDRAAMQRRAEAWRALLQSAASTADTPRVIAGDFNAGRRHADGSAEDHAAGDLLGRLETLGYRDAWRDLHGKTREISWAGCDRGGVPTARRIDHVFCSACVSGVVKTAHFDHIARVSGLSDHAPLVVEAELSALAEALNAQKPRKNKARAG